LDMCGRFPTLALTRSGRQGLPLRELSAQNGLPQRDFLSGYQSWFSKSNPSFPSGCWKTPWLFSGLL